MSLNESTAKIKTRLGFLTEMHRYPGQGWVAGVCAGIADYFGWRVKLVRLITFLLLVFTAGSVVIVAYIALWFLMEEGDFSNPDKPRYEKNLVAAMAAAQATPSGQPTATSTQLRERFGLLDARLRRMEEAALSKDAALFRELEKLERESNAPSPSA